MTAKLWARTIEQKYEVLESAERGLVENVSQIILDRWIASAIELSKSNGTDADVEFNAIMAAHQQEAYGAMCEIVATLRRACGKLAEPPRG